MMNIIVDIYNMVPIGTTVYYGACSGTLESLDRWDNTTPFPGKDFIYLINTPPSGYSWISIHCDMLKNITIRNKTIYLEIARQPLQK